MIFIIGIDRKKKQIGPIEERLCPHCSNEKHWILEKSSRFISLFFIPIIPISKKFYAYCPICNFSQEMAGEELRKKEQIAALNLEALHGNISDDAYQEKLKNIKL